MVIYKLPNYAVEPTTTSPIHPLKHPPITYPSLDRDNTPLENNLGYIGLTMESGPNTSSNCLNLCPISIGAGRPPVLIRLVKKIESRVFIKMGDLLPEWLSMSSADEDKKAKRIKCPLSILEWHQGYSIYVTVMSSKFPNRIPDLMGYQSLII